MELNTMFGKNVYLVFGEGEPGVVPELAGQCGKSVVGSGSPTNRGRQVGRVSLRRLGSRDLG